MLVAGCLLALGASVSLLAHRSFLSLAALFVGFGFLLGQGGIGVFSVTPQSEAVHIVAILALVLVLFSDGLEVDRELLTEEWRMPLGKLLLGLPITAGLVMLLAKLACDLSWPQALALGALLAPTDPILISQITNNPRVPDRIRHSLQLEAGLNDGLALPALTAAAALMRGEDFVWWQFLLQDLLLGLGVGLVIAALASRLIPSGQTEDENEHQSSLFVLGVALITYGATVALHGNGLIGVFVGALALGRLRPELGQAFRRRSGDVVEISKLAVFLCFGALLSWPLLSASGWWPVAVALLCFLVARPLAVLVGTIGARPHWDGMLFMAWFGPKGIATMTFALLLLSTAPEATELFTYAGVAVVLSLILHGASDGPGSRWMARRAQATSAAELGAKRR